MLFLIPLLTNTLAASLCGNSLLTTVFPGAPIASALGITEGGAGMLAVLISYLIGAIPFGYLLVRFTTGSDVRAAGSGNIGATNVLRTAGRGLGILTLLLDIAKGYFAVWLAAWLTRGGSEGAPVVDSQHVWTSAAAVAVLLGHSFPIFLKFKGGKAVASFTGAFFYLTPLALPATLAVFVMAVWRTRFISAGSVLSAFTFPLAVWIIEHPPYPVVAAALFASALIIVRHKDNISRLREGTERAFSFGSQAGGEKSYGRPQT